MQTLKDFVDIAVQLWPFFSRYLFCKNRKNIMNLGLYHNNNLTINKFLLPSKILEICLVQLFFIDICFFLLNELFSNWFPSIDLSLKLLVLLIESLFLFDFICSFFDSKVSVLNDGGHKYEPPGFLAGFHFALFGCSGLLSSLHCQYSYKFGAFLICLCLVYALITAYILIQRSRVEKQAVLSTDYIGCVYVILRNQDCFVIDLEYSGFFFTWEDNLYVSVDNNTKTDPVLSTVHYDHRFFITESRFISKEHISSIQIGKYSLRYQNKVWTVL